MDITLKDLIEIISSFIAGGGLAFHFTKKYYVKTMYKNKQIQKNGDNSHNYQSGRDMKIGKD